MINIYYLHRGDNIPCYIGKTNNLRKRINGHRFHKKDNSLQIELIDEVEDKDWKFHEQFYIQMFKYYGFKLENGNNGGGGPDAGREITWADKISKSQLLNNTAGKVYQYTKDNTLVKIWEAACVAEDHFNPGNRKKRDNIRANIRGKQKTAYGFIWKSFA
tara:strand:+ start:129 stop:608 length:480 start_codon:yes stop_codon:yes gene_type:complete